MGKGVCRWRRRGVYGQSKVTVGKHKLLVGSKEHKDSVVDGVLHCVRAGVTGHRISEIQHLTKDTTWP